MKKLLCTLAVLSLSVNAIADEAKTDAKTPPALNFKMKTLRGQEVDLANYKGKVLLVVNVASECGLTPQYTGLQALDAKYGDKGLEVMGFPCNQFGKQEPGSAKEIQNFCKTQYGVKFDMFAKVEVNGDGACPLYKYLTAQETKPKGAGKIGWNFEKFIIGRNGEVVARFSPRTKPTDPALLSVLEAELAKE